MKQSKLFAAVAAGALLVGAMPASATLITSRAALGGNDFIDWNDVAPLFTIIEESAQIFTNDGLPATLQGSGQGLERAAFGGDFAPGDQVVQTVGTPILSISFATGLRAIGAQIQDIAFDSSFLAFISCFDAVGNLLESYSRPGVSLSRGDNSALFLGVARDTADIARITFQTSTGGPFVINRVDLRRAITEQPAPPKPVSEPAAWALFALAAPAFVLLRRRVG